jgi:hypothetical protein
MAPPHRTRVARLAKLVAELGGVHVYVDFERLARDEPDAFACIEQLARRLSYARSSLPTERYGSHPR